VTERITIIVIELTEQDDTTLQDVLKVLTGGVAYSVLKTPLSDISPNDPPQCLVFPDLEIRINEQMVYRNGKQILLSHYEFFTLSYLALHPGWVFTREQIYETIWHEPGEDGRAIVTNTISQLRHKLWPENPKGGYIRTVRNSGYKFDPSQ
jgi:DNA-binding response OmpR family regulator